MMIPYEVAHSYSPLQLNCTALACILHSVTCYLACFCSCSSTAAAGTKM